MLGNKWRRLGRLIEPNKDIWWMTHFCGPTFASVNEDGIELYVVGRDEHGISRIGVALLDKSDPSQVLNISAEPVFDVGEVGCFDESGVSYPWIVCDGERKKLYYGGWQAGGIGGFQVNIGEAIYDKATKQFKRVSRAPILPRIDEEPICTGSLSVHRTSTKWVMYYTCFERWEKMSNGSYKHFYQLKVCYSEDGVNWQRPGKVITPFTGANEHVICKPMLIKEHNTMRMWVSYRGDFYRIGYAESEDGEHWTRKDQEFQWHESTPAIKGFDDVMQEYAFIFDAGGHRYMTYNGNGYGKTGVGLAILDE
ncbi:hypothetical protein [Thalassotalea montiporae]